MVVYHHRRELFCPTSSKLPLRPSSETLQDLPQTSFKIATFYHHSFSVFIIFADSNTLPTLLFLLVPLLIYFYFYNYFLYLF